MTRLRQALPAAFAAVLLLVSQGAGAQNIAPNHEFDTNTNGWTVTGGTVAWNALDWTLSPSSGSARVTNNGAPASAFTFLMGCFAVSPGMVIDYGVHFYIPSGQATTGGVYSTAIYFADATCSTAQLGASPSTTLGTTLDTWFVKRVDAYTVPAGAGSMLLHAGIVKNEAGGTFVAYVDGAFAGNTGTVPVTLKSFGAE